MAKLKFILRLIVCITLSTTCSSIQTNRNMFNWFNTSKKTKPPQDNSSNTNAKTRNLNIQKIHYDDADKDNEKNTDSNIIPITKYHIHKDSFKPNSLSNNQDLGGIILYAYNGKTNWKLNNIHLQFRMHYIKKQQKFIKYFFNFWSNTWKSLQVYIQM